VTSEGGLTVVAKVAVERRQSLQSLLEDIDAEVRLNTPQQSATVPFQALETLHFARFVLLDDELVLSTSFDGSKQRHIKDLAELLSAGLDTIFRHCELYWNYTGSVSQRLATVLKAHDVGVQTHFVGAIGVSARRIKESESVRQTVRATLDAMNAGERGGGPARVFAALQAVVDADAAAVTAGNPRAVAARVEQRSPFRTLLYYSGGFARLAVDLAIVPPLAVLFYPLLWQKEWTDAKRLERRAEAKDLEDRAADRAADDVQIRKVEKSDARFAAHGGVQNALSHVVNLKHGLTRHVALRVALEYVAYRAKYWDVEGDLAGIDSIHFARWVRLSGGRLLFLSDYDGSWESYLGDFVDEGAMGLSAIWSNTEQFPKTKALIAQGARDERGFKRWVRSHQTETQVWYSAYPRLTLRRILDNEALRTALGTKEYSDTEAERWLALA
jgi:hypothetical protein